MSDSLRPHGLQPTRLLRPWNFPGKSTGVGCHCLLRVILLLTAIWEFSVVPSAGLFDRVGMRQIGMTHTSELLVP